MDPRYSGEHGQALNVVQRIQEARLERRVRRGGWTGLESLMATLLYPRSGWEWLLSGHRRSGSNVILVRPAMYNITIMFWAARDEALPDDQAIPRSEAKE